MVYKKSIIVSIILGVFVVVAVASVYGYRVITKRGGGAEAMQGRSPTTELLEGNKNYKAARQFLESGNYAQAEDSYRMALSDTADPIQQAQIQLDIAKAVILQGRYVEAIHLLKQIIARTDLHSPTSVKDEAPTRAYAVQELGMMYYRYSAGKEIIAQETFKDAPYNAYLTDLNGRELAYRRLFEYGNSISPLALSESMVAFWYAHELRYGTTNASVPSANNEYVMRTYDALRKADADIERVKNNPIPASLFPEIYMREGIVLADMAAVGVGSYADAEARFKTSMEYSVQQHSKPGNLSAFFYAGFLASVYGNARLEDILSLLAAFRKGNEANINPEIPKYFVAVRTRDDLSVPQENAALLGTLDKGFKEYLMSLGWKEADFNIAKD